MTYDPIRKEELRIMGYAEAITGDVRMVKQLAVDGPVDTTRGREEAEAGDYLIEFPDGTVELVSALDFAELGYVMAAPEPTEIDASPVELAEPVGLLQREEVTDDA